MYNVYINKQSINNYNIVPRYKQINSDTEIKSNSIQNCTKQYLNTAKTYAITLPNFKAKALNNIDLLFSDTQTSPRISIQLLKNDSFEAKPALCPVYEIALHDQLYDLIARNPEIHDNGSCVKDYKRKIDINCSEENLIKMLEIIDKEFLSPKIQKRYIDNALHLAPIGYKLHKIQADTGFDYSDVPTNTTQEEYEQMIKNISFEDVQEYSDNIAKHSDIQLVLLLNKNFYDAHKKEISAFLNKFKNYNT